MNVVTTSVVTSARALSGSHIVAYCIQNKPGQLTVMTTVTSMSVVVRDGIDENLDGNKDMEC